MNRKYTVASIIETIIINLIIYQVYFVMEPNREVYLQLNPHPLLLLSLVAGLLYGNFLGMVSALISTLFYARGFFVVHSELSLLFAEFANFKYPLLFFWTAMVAGYVRDNQVYRLDKLRREKADLALEQEQLIKSHRLLQKAHQELKQQIVGSEESILHLYDIASRLETLDSEEVYTETIGIIVKYLKADQVAIYSYHGENGFLRLKIATGRGTEQRSVDLREVKGLQRVVAERQAVRWSEVQSENFPLMAAPLLKGEQVLAVVTVNHMAFDRMSEYAFQLFRLIIEWVNKALERTNYVDELRGSRCIEGTSLLKHQAYLQRVQAEEKRKQEFGLEYVTVAYQVQGLTLEQVDKLASQELRTVDVVSFEPEQQILNILLPATPADQLPVVEVRLLKSFGRHMQRVI